MRRQKERKKSCKFTADLSRTIPGIDKNTRLTDLSAGSFHSLGDIILDNHLSFGEKDFFHFSHKCTQQTKVTRPPQLAHSLLSHITSAAAAGPTS